MANYREGEHHPQKALAPRVMYIATDGDDLVGCVGGHLAQRYDCDGELQYLDVTPEYRRSGVAAGMLRCVWEWFQEHEAARTCVDVAPTNRKARAFYTRHGAVELNSHWMVWSDIVSKQRSRLPGCYRERKWSRASAPTVYA